MKKYLYPAAAMLVSAFALTSCLGSSSDDQKMTYNYGGSDCFNRVINLSTGSEYIASAPSYSFQYNTSVGEVDVTLTNVILSNGMSPGSYKLPTMKYSQDPNDGFIISSGRSITPEGASANLSSVVFDSFSLRAYPGRNLGSVFNIQYVIERDGETYQVTTYANRNVYLGPTSATNLDPEATKPTYSNANDLPAQAEMYYVVLLNMEKKTATLQVYNGKFADSMNPLTFMVKDVPLTLNPSGYNVISAQDAELPVYTATSGNDPAAGHSLTNLSIVATLERGATIRFTCDLGDSGKYEVVGSLRYLLYNTNTDNN